MDPTLTNRYQWPSSSMGMAIAAAGPRARGSVSRRGWHCPSFGRWGAARRGGWRRRADSWMPSSLSAPNAQAPRRAAASCCATATLPAPRYTVIEAPTFAAPLAQALRSRTVASDMLKIRRRKHVAPVAMAREPPPCAKLRLPRRRHQICVSFATTAIADSAAPMSRK